MNLLEIVKQIQQVNPTIHSINTQGYVEDYYYPPETCIVLLKEENEILENALCRLGCEVEFKEDWEECVCCGKLYRISADSDNWVPTHYKNTCRNCIMNNPEQHINENDNIITINIDLKRYGYKRIDHLFNNRSISVEEIRKKVNCKIKLEKLDKKIAKFSVWTKEDVESIEEDYNDELKVSMLNMNTLEIMTKQTTVESLIKGNA